MRKMVFITFHDFRIGYGHGNLINEKLRSITHEIDQILQKWNYDSIELFLDNSKSGKMRNAEDVAIVLEKNRAILVKNLIQTLEHFYDEKDYTNLCIEEAEQRSKEIEDGIVEFIPAETVFNDLKRRYH